MTWFPDVVNRAIKSHVTLGREALRCNDGEAALINFQIAKARSSSFMLKEPRSFLYLRDDAICWDQLGYTRQLRGEIQLAHLAYSEADRGYRAAVLVEGVYGLCDRERAKFLDRVWALCSLDEDRDGAAKALNQAVEIVTARYAADPDDIGRFLDLAIVRARLWLSTRQ